MKTKFGAIIVDGRGKIGGHVASKNRAGAYLRTKVTPVNPKSLDQIAIRARLATISSAWRALTQAQILAWNAAVANFAKTDIFGDIKNPSGINLFQKLNNNLLRVGAAQISDPPLPIAIPSLVTFTATQVHAGATTLTFTATPTIADMQLEVQGTKPVSTGVSFVKSEYRLFDSLAPATASPYVATVTYAAKFGGPGVVGQKVFFQARYVSLTTGQAGVSVACSAVIS
jgi:hypothetical protein